MHPPLAPCTVAMPSSSRRRACSAPCSSNLRCRARSRSGASATLRYGDSSVGTLERALRCGHSREGTPEWALRCGQCGHFGVGTPAWALWCRPSSVGASLARRRPAAQRPRSSDGDSHADAFRDLLRFQLTAVRNCGAARVCSAGGHRAMPRSASSTASSRRSGRPRTAARCGLARRWTPSSSRATRATARRCGC
ncbi:hypothetical protein M885DRAFT_221796 [Pelagophyceae sp. CCMP2097]|nr:hypothetical protein M885DRAFT_221796 [Pelagophyceae sp. CCMP2097]